MQSPGSVVGAVRAGCSPGSVSWGMLGSHAVAWLGGPGSSGPIRLPGVGDGAVPARGGAPDVRVGSGGAGMAPVGSAVGWGGGQPAIRLAGQPLAALMDRAVVGPAQQGQVGQVGGAAMEPVPQMVGVAPGQGPFTVGEDTAPVPHGQGGALAGLDDPGGPADLQGLGRGPTQDSGQQGGGGLEPGCQPVGPAPVVGLGWWRAAGVVGLGWWLGVGVGGGRWWVQPLDVAWGWARRSLVGAGGVAGRGAGVGG